jgi:hypothetical protein
MEAAVGSRIVVESERVAQSARCGVIEDVLQVQPPRYRVRWDDGRTSIITPASGRRGSSDARLDARSGHGGGATRRSAQGCCASLRQAISQKASS